MLDTVPAERKTWFDFFTTFHLNLDTILVTTHLTRKCVRHIKATLPYKPCKCGDWFHLLRYNQHAWLSALHGMSDHLISDR